MREKEKEKKKKKEEKKKKGPEELEKTIAMIYHIMKDVLEF